MHFRDILKKGKARAVLKIFILIACCSFVVRMILELGPDRVLAATKGADPLWLGACLAPMAGRYLVWAWKWRLMLARRFTLSFPYLFRLIMAGSFINLVTPTAKLGGGFARALAIRKRADRSWAEAYGWVLADQLTTGFGKILLIGGLCLVAWLFLPFGEYEAILLGTCLFCLFLAFAWPMVRPALWRRICRPGTRFTIKKWLPAFLTKATGEKREGWIRPLLEPTLAVGTPRQVFCLDMGLSALSFWVFCLSNALVLKALGAQASLTAVALVVLCGYFAGTILGVMGGIGVTELFLMKMYTYTGIPPEIAAAGALLHRALFYAFVLIVGGWAAWRERELTRPGSPPQNNSPPTPVVKGTGV